MACFALFADQSNGDCTKQFIQSWIYTSISSSGEDSLWQKMVWLHDYYRDWQIKKGIGNLNQMFTK